MKDQRDSLINFPNKWVALNNRKRVLASGRTIKEVYARARKIRAKNFILMFVLPADVTYSPHVN